jgi:hypothetical protein
LARSSTPSRIGTRTPRRTLNPDVGAGSPITRLTARRTRLRSAEPTADVLALAGIVVTRARLPAASELVER